MLVRFYYRIVVEFKSLSSLLRRPVYFEADAQAGSAVLPGFCPTLLHLHHWSSSTEGSYDSVSPPQLMACEMISSAYLPGDRFEYIEGRNPIGSLKVCS